MILDEVVNKLALELMNRTGNIGHAPLYREFLNMAVIIGMEHFTPDMIEIVALLKDGAEAGRYKCTAEASRKLGIAQGNITAVLEGRRHTAGGYLFIRKVDWDHEIYK